MLIIQGVDEISLEDTMFKRKIGPSAEKRYHV